MHHRSILASLLAVLLLAVSTAGAGCTVRCDLHAIAGGCTGHQHAMEGMHPVSCFAHSSVAHIAPAACAHRLCTPQPAQLSDRDLSSALGKAQLVPIPYLSLPPGAAPPAPGASPTAYLARSARPPALDAILRV